MILEYLVQWFFQFIVNILSDLTQIVTIPSNLINVIGTITGYGTYLVGSDVLVLIIGSFLFWTTMRCTVGLALSIWKLLPFT